MHFHLEIIMPNTDIPWPKEYIDKRTRPAVDMQYIDIRLALQNTGIKLHKEPKPRHSYKCGGCGKFVTEREYYEVCYHGFNCHHCDERY